MVNTEFVALASRIALQHDLDPALVCAVAEQESSWDTWAVRYEPTFLKTYVAPLYNMGKISATECYTRSMSWGLMQVMGQTAREFGFDRPSLAELCEPDIGLEFGCRRLANCVHRPGIDERAALLKYNGGKNPNYPEEVIARKAAYAANIQT